MTAAHMRAIADAAAAETLARVVPVCSECGELSGLYYAECLVCFAHASDYSLGDYTATRDST